MKIYGSFVICVTQLATTRGRDHHINIESQFMINSWSSCAQDIATLISL